MNYLHKGDLPEKLKFPSVVAIDTETMGLNFSRDKLCLVQISFGDKNAHLVQVGGALGYGAKLGPRVSLFPSMAVPWLTAANLP